MWSCRQQQSARLPSSEQPRYPKRIACYGVKSCVGINQLSTVTAHVQSRDSARTRSYAYSIANQNDLQTVEEQQPVLSYITWTKIARALLYTGTAVLFIGAVAAAFSISPAGSFASSSTGQFHKNVALSSAGTGIAAGFFHTLCGPDHLAALTPLTIGRNRYSASLLGSLWGLGHSTGQLLLGVAFVCLKQQFKQFLPLLERWSGPIVGCTLMTIGALGIVEALMVSDEDEQGEDEAVLRKITSSTTSSEARIAAVTYATGILYGLQPDALFTVIPALALAPVAAVTYCIMFVIGTVVAMGGYTLFIATTSEKLCKDRPHLQQNLSGIASCMAILVGVVVLLSGFGFEIPILG